MDSAKNFLASLQCTSVYSNRPTTIMNRRAHGSNGARTVFRVQHGRCRARPYPRWKRMKPDSGRHTPIDHMLLVVVQRFNKRRFGLDSWLPSTYSSVLFTAVSNGQVDSFSTHFPARRFFELSGAERLVAWNAQCRPGCFHLFEHEAFLTSCRRLLGLNYGMIPDPLEDILCD
jgi:hypothetical protein